MGLVYLIRNTVNGKCYVGQTRRDIHERWKEHIRKTQYVLGAAMAFYGKDKFEFSVICEVPNDDLNDREVKEIAERETLVPNGYNLQIGGENRDMHEETKRKIGANSAVKLKGKKMPETTREALRKANTGRSAPLTEEHKQRVREGKRGVMKPVDQFTRDGVFVKAWESVRATGVSGVAECCNGWTKSAGRFVWKWRDPPEVLPPKPVKSAEQRDKMNERRRARRAARRV
jgi:group I intron endonuclease